MSRDVARRLYLKGDQALGVPPVKDSLEEDRSAVRAELAEEERKRQTVEDERRRAEAKKAAEDARNSRREEAQMIRLGRSASIQLLVGIVKMGPGLQQLTEDLKARLSDPEKLAELSPEKAGLLLQRASAYAKTAVQAGQTAMEMERLYLGEPTHILGVQDEDGTMSLDEAETHITKAMSTLKRARERGVDVLHGVPGEEGEGAGPH